MADLVLNWSAIGASSSQISPGLGQDGAITVDTGGVAVDVSFDSQSDMASAFVVGREGYVAPGEDIDPDSHLKLWAPGNATGSPTAEPTSTTTFDFRSTNDLYTDSVQNVSFRLNDVDSGVQDFTNDPGAGFTDEVTITAYDAEGNPAIITITSAGAATVSGSTAIGAVTTDFDSADGSLLVEIAGPIQSMEVVYDNGGAGQQAVLISDISFSTVDVCDDNRPPVAVDDEAETDFETPVVIDVDANDSDPDGDPLTVIEVTDGANGTAVIDEDGNVVYTPGEGFEGEDTISYTISDGNGGTDSAEVVITVGEEEGENSPPVAEDDTASTPLATAVVIDVLANDSDPDVGDTLTITQVAFGPSNGTAEITGDTITYTPDPGFTGTDTFFYFIEDEAGDVASAEVTVTVTEGGGGEEGRIDVDVFPVAPGDQLLDPLNGLDQDPDPFDDLDSIDGSGADEVISTGDDADTIFGNGGDDTIRPGIDDDSVSGGTGDDFIEDIQGSDTIRGGQGDDTIIAGIDTFSDYANDDPNLPLTIGSTTFETDPNPDDGRDFVEGNQGDDLIYTGDDADTIDGGQGDDTIFAGIDDDAVTGNEGDDEIFGGHGSDTLDGGQGDDLLDGSAPISLEITDDADPQTENDRDLLQGFLGDDTLIGGDDDDTLEGGSGEDLLDGGIDEDSLSGGDDDDTLIGGDGDDTLKGDAGQDEIDGGADRDVIVVSSAAEGAGDTVQGGNAGDDFDVLDLTGVGEQDVDWRLVDVRPDDDGDRPSNGIDGTVEFLDGEGGVTGTMDFFNIEEIVPCFTPGTKVATPQGERLVEDLREGDRIITRDNGLQEIRWIGRKDLTGFELARKPHMKPILIRAGSLGNGLPEHDMLVSPNHRMLVNNDKTALYFEEREVLAAAKHLTGLDGVSEVAALGVSYIHFMFDRHEVVLANGAWTESFQPGDYSLKGIGNAQRNEILELFPELAETEGLKGYASARRSLKKHEARLLTR